MNGKGNVAEQRRRYKERHPEKIKLEKKKYKKAHPEKSAAYVIRHSRKVRDETIDHYSNGKNICALCGESNKEFLEIARSDLGVGGETNGQSKIYEYLKSHKYPDGYIIICSNCNLKRIRQRAFINSIQPGENEKRAWYLRDYKLRVDVMNHYTIGGKIKCDCCGNGDIDVLCMDHKNGDGAEHRKKVSGSMYQWIKNNGYPDTFRVLCANCNQSLGTRGYCPHKLPKYHEFLHIKNEPLDIYQNNT